MRYKKICVLMAFVVWGMGGYIILSFSDNEEPQIYQAYASAVYDPNSLDMYFSSYQKYRNNNPVTIPGAIMLVLMKNKLLDNDNIMHVKGAFIAHDKVKFIVPFLKYDNDSYYALIPIAYDTEAGSYKFEINFTFRDSLERKQRIPQNTTIMLDVQERNFFTEEVKLNKKLAKRKTSPPSPKVVKEANEIWDITGSVDVFSRYALSDFIFPVEEYKYITGMFADRRVYTYMDGNVISGLAHGGIDIATDNGAPVYASATGKVVLAKERVVTGKSIVLEHYPGVFTMYYHLESIDVQVGDIIMKGTQIGGVGNTGFSTGTHLHWEMRVNNIRVDPLLSLGQLDNIKTIDIIYK